MITAEKDTSPIPENDPQDKLAALKQKINSEDYLVEAIQRIAQVLSNEITGTPGGKGN